MLALIIANTHLFFCLRPVDLEDKSDLKQEIEYMKTRIEVLGADITRLQAELKDMENLNLDLKTQLKEVFVSHLSVIFISR